MTLDDVENMSLHVMDLPKRVVVGNGTIRYLSRYIEELSLDGPSQIAVVTGPNLANTLVSRLTSNLEGLSYKIYIAYKSTWKELEKIEKQMFSESNPAIIIGFGGGKSIDIAKLISYRNGKTFVSIPTSPSHDGIASLFASLKGYKKAYSIKAIPPSLVLVDMDIIAKAPKRLIASGVGDALAKFTAVEDWRLAHEEIGEYYGEYASNLALMSAKLVMKKIEGISIRDEDSVRTLVEALISTGVAAGIAGSSRPCSGSEHLFSHALDLYVNNEYSFHGEQVGIGTIMMAYLHGLDWEAIKNAIKIVGGPTTYKELKMSKDDIIKGVIYAKQVRPERYTILNKYNIDRRFAEELAKKTGVI